MSTVNAAFRSDDPRGRAMSNLSAHAFVMDGVRCGSVEGFIQGIKLPPGDPYRDEALALSGVAAWKMRIRAKGEFVWWNGETVVYRSPVHAALIERAIKEKFARNPDALEAMMATRGLTIIHKTSVEESPTTTLPAIVYCRILTELRDNNI